MTPSTSSAANAFVLEHSSTIAKIARHLWTDRRMEPEDFHQELLLLLLRRHHKFDPERGKASTWIYFMARALKDHTLRAMRSRGDQQHDTVLMGEKLHLEPSARGWGSHEQMVIKVELQQVLKQANPKMREACASHLEGWTGDEVSAAFGCSMTARNDRIRRLGQRVS